MDTNSLQQQIATTRKSLFDEGILGSFFVELESLEGTNNPNCVEEIFTTYFTDSPKTIDAIDKTLEQLLVDFTELERCFLRFKGPSSSVGANKLTIEINQALELGCKQRDLERCKAAVERMKQEYNTLRNGLEPYFQLLRQTRSAEKADSPK